MLTYSGTNVDRLDTITDLFLLFVRHCVRYDDLFESAAIQCFDGRSTQNTVSDNSNGVLRSALVNQHTSSFDKSTAGVCHIVHKNGRLSSYLSNKCHSGDFIRTSALFMDERKRQIETISDGCRSVCLLALHAQE